MLGNGTGTDSSLVTTQCASNLLGSSRYQRGENIFKYYAYFLGSWLGLLIMFSFTFALNYHFCNGVRHLFWDAGYGYEISTVYKSGLAVVIISLLSTCLIWYFILINNA